MERSQTVSSRATGRETAPGVPDQTGASGSLTAPVTFPVLSETEAAGSRHPPPILAILSNAWAACVAEEVEGGGRPLCGWPGPRDISRGPETVPAEGQALRVAVCP